jgi:hypothetical protein
MRYTVVWQQSAERRLAAIYLECGDRNAVTVAANEIDRLLKFRPTDIGESRSGNLRFLYIEPLAVEYAVFQDDRLVRVAKVHQVSQPD